MTMSTIDNPTENPRIAAVFLRAHLRMLAAGMRNSQLSGSTILRKATAVTGNTYKRGQYAQAIDDLNAILKS